MALLQRAADPRLETTDPGWVAWKTRTSYARRAQSAPSTCTSGGFVSAAVDPHDSKLLVKSRYASSFVHDYTGKLFVYHNLFGYILEMSRDMDKGDSQMRCQNRKHLLRNVP